MMKRYLRHKFRANDAEVEETVMPSLKGPGKPFINRSVSRGLVYLIAASACLVLSFIPAFGQGSPMANRRPNMLRDVGLIKSSIRRCA